MHNRVLLIATHQKKLKLLTQNELGGILSNRNLRALILFNKKANELRESRFVNFILKTKRFTVSFDVKKVGEGARVKIKKDLPDKHAIAEFVLTFRFFIQDNEDSSFRNLAKVYDELAVSRELKTRFSEIRSRLNDYLDSEPQIKFKIDNQTLRRRTIMEAFIYGKLAHANTEKEKIFNQWANNPLLFPMLEFEFNNILEFLLRVIHATSQLNAKAIEELKSTKNPS